MLNVILHVRNLAYLGLALAFAGSAQAGYVVNVFESGGDVVAVGSGTLDVKNLEGGYGGDASSYIIPDDDVALFGGTVLGNSVAYQDYYSIFSIGQPNGFGPGFFESDASSATGDIVGIYAGDEVLVPSEYVSGSLLNSTSTWSGQTFDTLGLTPGTYTWTWGFGGDADTFTINIGPSVVPEPASFIMLGIGLVGVLGHARRRKVRAPVNIP